MTSINSSSYFFLSMPFNCLLMPLSVDAQWHEKSFLPSLYIFYSWWIFFFPSYIVFWDTFCLKSRHSRRQNKRGIKDRRRKKKVFHHIFFGNHVLVTQRDKDTKINKRGIDLNFKRSNPNDECPWKIMMMGKLSCHIRAIKKAHEKIYIH